MALVYLVKDPDIRRHFEPLLADLPRPPDVAVKVPLHRKGAGPLVGTAFDYAVRFELQRRYPNAVTRSWCAEGAIAKNGFGLTGPIDDTGLGAAKNDLTARWATIIRDARAAVSAYVADQSIGLSSREEVVGHALRLGRIDPFVRGNYLDPEPERVEPDDVADILEMMDIVPWDQLGSSTLLWLNPTFGNFSRRVGGADADIIAGDRLLDLKTTSVPTHTEDLRQLLGYLILARAARTEDQSFPIIGNIGAYHGRHGHLWYVPVVDLTSHPAFAVAEERFFERATELAIGVAERDRRPFSEGPFWPGDTGSVDPSGSPRKKVTPVGKGRGRRATMDAGVVRPKAGRTGKKPRRPAKGHSSKTSVAGARRASAKTKAKGEKTGTRKKKGMAPNRGHRPQGRKR